MAKKTKKVQKTKTKKLTKVQKTKKRLESLWGGVYCKRRLKEKGWKFLTIESLNQLSRDIAKYHIDTYYIRKPNSKTTKIQISGMVTANYYSDHFINSKTPVTMRTKLTRQRILELLDRMDKMKFGEIHLIHSHYDNLHIGINEATVDLDFDVEEVGF